MSRQGFRSLWVAVVVLLVAFLLLGPSLMAEPNVDLQASPHTLPTPLATPGPTMIPVTLTQEPAHHSVLEASSFISQDIIFPPVQDQGPWKITQGYNTSWTHGTKYTNERYAFDLILRDNPGQTAGKTVVSGVSGIVTIKVASTITNGGGIGIRLDNAYTHPKQLDYLFAKYWHLSGNVFDKLKVGDHVEVNQPIGVVHDRDNHIHFNLFSSNLLGGGSKDADRSPEWCRTCPASVLSPTAIARKDSWDPDGSTNQYYGWVIQPLSGPSPNQPPQARFTISVPHLWTGNIWAYVGETVSFNGSTSSDPDGQVVRWDWYFGDGVSQGGGSNSTTHIYTTPGTYQVRLTVTDNAGARNTSETQAVRVLSRTQTQQNVDVALVIDCTGSMNWGDRDPAGLRKQAAKVFIQLARTGDKIAVIGFTTQSYIFAALTEIRSQADKDALQQAVDQVFSSGDTDLGVGLQAGYDQLNSDTSAITRRAAVFLTDGEQDCGSGCDYHDQHLLYRSRGWRVYTVGLGSGQDAALLQRIASETGGTYYNSPESANLQAIYRDLSGQLTGETSLLHTVLNLSQGASQSIAQSIPGIPQLTASLLWSGTATGQAVTARRADGTLTTIQASDARLYLVDPTGHQVDPNDPTIEHQKGTTFELYRLRDPQPGTWTFRVQVLSASGTIPLTLDATTVDVVPPIGQIVNYNPYVNSRSIQLSFDVSDPGHPTAADIEFRLSNDGTIWSNWQPLTGAAPWTLPDSNDVIYVYAQFRDAAGNTSSGDIANFFLDTVPPETTITSGPSGPVSTPNVTFIWEGTDNAGEGDSDYDYSWKLDGYDADWSPFTSGALTKTYNGLSVGTYTFRVRTRDFAGNIDQTPAERSFTVQQSLLPDKFLFAIGAQAPVGQFNGPTGIAVAPDGTVYVADMENNRIQRFTATGAFIGMWGSLGIDDGQFNGPEGVAVAPDGTVYVADTWNHRIQRFSPTGAFLNKWGSQGSGDGQFQSPTGVSVASGGTVYVADSGNHRIQRFSATGTFQGKWGSQGSGDGQFNGPWGVAIDTDGTIYVADIGNCRIQHFSATGAFLGKWGNEGSGNGQFRSPAGLAVGGGRVYVADKWNYRVQVFTTAGTYISQWAYSYWLEGVALGGSNRVYVADSGSNRVEVRNTDGNFVTEWGSRGSSDGQFERPTSVFVATDGTVYVVDLVNHRVQRFSATGQFLGKWGSYGSGDGQFAYPWGGAVALDGTIYVADTNNHRIQRFSATGLFLGKWGSYGSGDGQFNYPKGVAVAPDGTVYVADTGNHRIQRFSAAGAFLGKWGSQGSGDGQFNGPTGVAVATDGTVYVADRENHRIQRFSATGQFLGKWGSVGSGDGQFVYPHSVAVAPDSMVYVADTDNNHRIQRFSATGEFRDKWGSYGSSCGQLWGPRGVAVALDSTVYVADTNNNRIQAFGPAYPTTWRGEYFANRWLVEAPVLIRQDAAISFNWGAGSPGTSVPSDNFSARWQRYVWFDTVTYRFTIFTDDGVRLWIDDKLLIEAWQDPQVATYSADISLTQGYHRVRLEYYEASGSAAVQLNWGPTTQNVAVAINPASKSATVGEIFTLDIRISAGSQLVDAVDSYLSFDRNYLRVVDASGNETNSIMPGSMLPVVLQNSADNSQGRITYSAGKQLGGVSPSGDFVLATIRFKAVAATGGGVTNVNFLSGTGVFYQGNSLPIFTSNGNVQIQEAISLKGRVTLQGRGSPPDNRWNNFPLAITLYSPGGTSPVGNYTANTDASGYFTVTGITQGTYDAKVKSTHTLSNKKTNIGIPTGPTGVDFGTLLEGDANNDDKIGGADYSILATAYSKCSGQSGWDSRADFNGSGCIDGADYSLLASNYGRYGPIALAITRVGPMATEVITGSVVISIDPSSKSVSPGTIFTLDIKIAAGGQAVDAADSYLSFDRNYLRVVDASSNETNSIIPGATLPVVLQNSADNSQGHIAYSAGKQLGGVSPSGDFVLATIHFKAIAALPGGGTAIAFQSGTDVFYLGNSVLGALVNGTVNVTVPFRFYIPSLLHNFAGDW